MELPSPGGISFAPRDNGCRIERRFRDHDRPEPNAAVQGQDAPVFGVAAIELDGVLLMAGQFSGDPQKLMGEQKTVGFLIQSAEDLELLLRRGQLFEGFVPHVFLLKSKNVLSHGRDIYQTMKLFYGIPIALI